MRILIALGLGLVLRAQDQKPDRWEADIRKFEEQDKKEPPPKEGVVFVGSSSIRLWDVKASFPDLPCVNRGFGGSQIADSVRHADRIITPHQPRVVVVFAGGNDIHSGKTPEKVAQDFQELTKKIQAALPKTRIFYISLFPNVARRTEDASCRKVNELIEAFTKTDARLGFVDTASKMRAADGGPRPELLRDDGLHMNAEGYKIWNETVGPRLREALKERP